MKALLLIATLTLGFSVNALAEECYDSGNTMVCYGDDGSYNLSQSTESGTFWQSEATIINGAQ